MTDAASATADLLAERPELEDDLRTILAVDDDGTWTFDDVPLDSGAFGEIVATDIVESVDDAYRLCDPDAVRAVLDDEYTADSSGGVSSTMIDSAALRQRLDTVDPTMLAVLAGLLLFVVVMRTAFSWSAVFRDEHVVLLSNDPYFYRFWLDELTRTPATLGSLPADVRSHDVFMIASLWVGTLLLGGTQQAVSTVLTWYPVVAAVAVGALLYWIATVSFGDRRVGFATVGIYAVTPILAYRSALGFGDHHAFDYLLVTLAVAGLVALVSDSAEWRTVTARRVTGAVAVVLGVAGQVHAWRGGSLLVAPLAAYIVVRVLADRRADRDPLAANAWFLGALGTAAAVSLVLHFFLGWSPLFRAVTPLLLFGGSIVTVGIGVFAHRRDVRARTVFGAELVGGAVVGVLAWITVPALRDALARGSAYFARTGSTGITETTSLFSPEYGVVVTPFYYLGLQFVLGVIVLVAVSYRLFDVDRPVWLVVVSYGWVFFAAAIIQVRFASQFGLLCAIFAGAAFVYLLAVVDLTDSITDDMSGWSSVERGSVSLPSVQVLVLIAVVFALIGSFGALQTATGTDQTTVEDATYEAALAIDKHATATNTTWPDNYVFSQWGWNRALNYYVNGQSESYAYAQSNYYEFLPATDPKPWYDRLAEKSVGYIVIEPSASIVTPPPDSMQARLWSNWGSATNETAGLGRYRAIYATDDRKVYRFVPGAELRWEGAPDETQLVRTSVTVGNETVSYQRRARGTDDGQYSVRVPYPGSYTVGSEQVTVSETAVRNGESVSV
jgi:dolichyl-diphosphooligosaccharide--protein glycosyltransferase